MDKQTELMKLDIQMFAEEADNTIIDENIDDLDVELDTNEETDLNIESETDDSTVNANGNEENDKKASTKAYSERLNREREKIRSEIEQESKNKLDAIAKARNFTSWEELEEYDEQERLEKMGIENTAEFKTFLDTLISKNSIVKEAQMILETQKAQDKQRFITEQITAISKIDSSIKTLDDLTTLDRYDEFASKIDKGYTLVDAYKLVYFDKLKSGDIEKAKQTAINNIDSKSHMKSTQGASGNDIHVPAEIIAMYKKNIPGMSDADIRKHYARTMGGNN